MANAFAHYEILGAIGAGGMGEVWKARDSRLGRLVALKLLPEGACAEDGTVERFRREAQSASRLNHPNICTIYDFLEDDGRYAIVMELLEGENLQDRLARGPLAIDGMLRVAVPVADAIAFAHSQGVLHRDIKPGNIFLSGNGIAKILDFGLAKLTEPNANTLSSIDATVVSPGPDAVSLTQMGGTVGTVSYMSPEQALGRDLDARSDVFSFGATLYEMATGRRAFDGPTMAAVTDALLHRDPPRARELRSEIPAGLENVIVKSMQKGREDRFEDMHALARALKEADWSEAPRNVKSEKTSIAVLPFRHMSADPDDEYFADGISEEIINSLTKIGPLRVVSRTSSFAFKGKDEDIRTIGSTLDVNVVLEGSVRKAGNRVRITSQLVNVENGYHLWSERFDRTMDDIFAVQDEIAESIAAALEIVLTNEEREMIREAPTENAEAYEYYLRGRVYLWQLSAESLEIADEMFRKALRLDPRFMAALASRVELLSWIYLWLKADDLPALKAKAIELSAQADAIDPKRPEAHFARALTHWMEQDYAGAIRAFRAACHIDPAYWEAHFYAGRCAMEAGRLEEAAELFEESIRMRPEEYQAAALRASCLKGSPQEAEAHVLEKETLLNHLKLHPDDTRALGFLVLVHAIEGDEEKTRAIGERLLAGKHESGFLYNVACAYARQGWREEAFDIMREIVDAGWGNPEWIEADPDMDPLRDDPRFEEILATARRNRGRPS